MKKTIITALILTFLLNVPKVKAETISFDRILCTSIENSYDLKQSKLNTEISQKGIKEARSEYFPTITAYSTSEYSDDLTDGTSTMTSVGNEILIDGSKYQNALSVGASYNVFDFGVRKRKLNIAKTDKTQKEIMYKQELRDLKIDIAEIYSQALIYYKELKIKQNILGIQAELYKINERLNNAGKVQKLDVINEAIKVAELTTQINEAKINLAKTLKEISFYTNQNYDTATIKLTDMQEEHIVPISFKQEVIELKAEVNQLIPELTPEYKIYDLEIDKKQKEYEILKRYHLPKFQFDTKYYLYGTDKDSLVDAFNDLGQRTLTFRLATVLPVFDGFKNSAQKDKLKLEIEKIKVEKEQTLAELSKKYEQIREDSFNAKKQLENNYKTLELVNNNLSMIERLNNSGVIDKTVYLKQKAELLNKKFELEQSQVRSFVAQYKLNVLKESSEKK